MNGEHYHYGLQQPSLQVGSATRNETVYSTGGGTTSFENLYSQFNPQQWLTASAMPWDDWDHALADLSENVLNGI